jgi:hypothetical protein
LGWAAVIAGTASIGSDLAASPSRLTLFIGSAAPSSERS